MTSHLSRWSRFAALIPGTAIVFLDQTILPVALPKIQEQMGASSTALQWAVNAYLLTIAIFVLVTGKLGDRIGHRRALMWGIFGFTLSSLLCGFSTTIGQLIWARAMQGASAAFMFPAQTTLLALLFSPEQRGKATGVIVSVGSLFLVLGPLLGGYCVQKVSWEWIFWINLPVGVLGIWLTRQFLPESERGSGKIDWIGFLLFAVGIGSATLIFMEANDWGWKSNETIVCAIAASLSLTLLLLREKWAKHPFMDLSLFKHSAYAAINITVTITQFFMMIGVFRTIYLQEILSYTPLQTGFIMFASSMPIMVMAPVAGYLSDKFSPRVPIAIGFLMLIFSCLWFSFFSTPTLLALIIALSAFGIGIPLLLTPSYASAVASVPPGKSGTALGMIATLRMTGGSMGLALIHLFVVTIQEKTEPVLGKRLSVIASFSKVHLALAILLIVAFALTFILHSRKSSHKPPSAPAAGWD